MGPRMAAQREGCADETDIEPYRLPFALLAISTFKRFGLNPSQLVVFKSSIDCKHKYQIYDVMQIP